MDEIFQLNKGKLGFGLMRLPKDGSGKIDAKETASMVDKFIESGFTYFDTAYVYPGSEEIFKETIGTRHRRDSYTIASKLSGWALTDDFTPEKMFEEQLRRTGLDYFDFYLLHSIEKDHLPNYEKYDTWDFCQRLKKEGKIRHFGFSFHDTPELLDKLLTEHPETEFVQLQINYLDWTSPRVQSARIYEVARKHNKPIIIMEPVKGGLLSDLESTITEPFGDKTPASMALRFAAGLDGVLAVLSGMSTPEQVNENIRIFSNLEKLSSEEEKEIEEVRERIKNLQVIECTSCRYCTPGCPEKIVIPNVFRYLNEAAVRSDKEKAKKDYAAMIAEGKSGRASSCIRCGKCEKVCPQKLPIRTLLSTAEEKLCYTCFSKSN